MLLPPDLVSIKRVKIMIYTLKLLSWLSINFYKSSIYQLGPPHLDLSQVSATLHCRIGSFPFTYLGLPLNPTTLSKMNWQPLIDIIDKRLIAWKSHSLSRRGRLILVNSVLTSLPIYFMSFCFLPQWKIDHIDHLRRAFFSKGDRKSPEDNACLVAIFYATHAALVDLVFVSWEILLSPFYLNGGGSLFLIIKPPGFRSFTSITIDEVDLWICR